MREHLYQSKAKGKEKKIWIVADCGFTASDLFHIFLWGFQLCRVKNDETIDAKQMPEGYA
jgi:hypothetical protein